MSRSAMKRISQNVKRSFQSPATSNSPITVDNDSILQNEEVIDFPVTNSGGTST